MQQGMERDYGSASERRRGMARSVFEAVPDDLQAIYLTREDLMSTVYAQSCLVRRRKAGLHLPGS
jgi:hypothetical protein